MYNCEQLRNNFKDIHSEAFRRMVAGMIQFGIIAIFRRN